MRGAEKRIVSGKTFSDNSMAADAFESNRLRL
jgi:hypothetical protein